MWKPTTHAMVEAALPALQESEVLDVKQDVPASKKAGDFAVDVAAMANDGGSIVYGIAEDKIRGVFSAQPILLAGQSERISDVVHQLIQDPPRFQVWDVPLETDPARGFLVVAVPASPLAPHMVRNTFWGRVGTINVKLSQGEVDRLYTRRRIWEQDSEAALRAALEDMPGRARQDGQADLHVVVHPLLSDNGTLARSRFHDAQRLRDELVANTNTVRFKVAPPLPSTLSILANGRFNPTLRGVAYQFDGQESQALYRLELLRDGTVRFFWSGAVGRRGGNVRKTIHETTCAQIVLRVLHLALRLLSEAQYDGPLTAAVCLQGAYKSVSDVWNAPDSQGANLGILLTDDYREVVLVETADLQDDPSGVARELIGPVLAVVRPSAVADPLET